MAHTLIRIWDYPAEAGRSPDEVFHRKAHKKLMYKSFLFSNWYLAVAGYPSMRLEPRSLARRSSAKALRALCGAWPRQRPVQWTGHPARTCCQVW